MLLRSLEISQSDMTCHQRETNSYIFTKEIQKSAFHKNSIQFLIFNQTYSCKLYVRMLFKTIIKLSLYFSFVIIVTDEFSKSTVIRYRCDDV